MGSRRLRLLHAIHDFLPRHQAGSEIYAANLCAAMAARGHHPLILCAEFDPAREHGELTWRTYEGLPVIEIANNWKFSSFDDTYQSPAISRVLGQVLDIVQPDVLHVHSLMNLSMDLPRLARARGIPVAATLHDYTPVCPSGGQRIHRAERHICHTLEPARCARCFPDTPFHTQLVLGRMTGGRSGRFLGKAASAVRRTAPGLAVAAGAALKHAPVPLLDAAAIERRLAAARDAFTFFDTVVAPSRALADEYRRLGFPTEKLVVSDYGLPDLVPIAGLEPCPTAAGAGTNRALRVGYVGMPIWHKGVDLLIDAIRLLPSAHVEALIFGDLTVAPDYVRDLTARAAGLRVQFKGVFGRDDLAAVFSQIDLLIVPSRWIENSPLVIHEAVLAGVPVAGARIGGITELIEDGRNGVLFEPDSPEALAEAISRVLADPACLSRFRAALPSVKSIEHDAVEWEGRYAALVATDAGRVPPGRHASAPAGDSR